MVAVRLGRRSAAAIGQVTKTIIVFDTDLKGFGLCIRPPSSRNPSGSRSWIVEYRPGAGGRNVAKRRISLGSADTLPAEQARDAAKTLLASVRLGADPAAQRSDARIAKRVEDLHPLYAGETDPLRKARTIELYGSYWRGHILPALGGLPARAVTKADIVRLHRAIGRAHRTTANRVVTLLAHFFGWAGDAGYVPKDHNPARGVERFKEAGRERYLSVEELGRLGEAIRVAETVGVEWAPIDESRPAAKHTIKDARFRRTTIDSRAAAALRLLLFTGARLREILHLEWEHVDLGRGLLLLPDSKTGRKTIVLGAPALAILKDLHAMSRLPSAGRSARISKFVIFGESVEKPRADLKRPWALVTRHASLLGLRLHDLRHSFASVGAGAGLGLPIIGKLLGHSDSATTARYAHLDADPLRRATDAISGAIAAALCTPDEKSVVNGRARRVAIEK